MIRVIRVLEYQYDNLAMYKADSSRWRTTLKVPTTSMQTIGVLVDIPLEESST